MRAKPRLTSTNESGDLCSALYIVSLPQVKVTVQAMFLLHLLSTLPVILNPPFQFLEEILSFPSGLKIIILESRKYSLSFLEFGWRRVLLRSGTVGCLLLIALSVPNFEVILQLIGSTTISLLNLVLPPLFYLILNRKYQAVTSGGGGDQETSAILSRDFHSQ